MASPPADMISGGKQLTYQNFPNVIAVIQKFSENDPSVAQFFSSVL